MGGHGLVATAEQDDGIHGLGPYHLLGLQGEKVAVEHGGGRKEELPEAGGGKYER
jgi:hypothetical protein